MCCRSALRRAALHHTSPQNTASATKEADDTLTAMEGIVDDIDRREVRKNNADTTLTYRLVPSKHHLSRAPFL